jgi:hypothetical protein
MSSIHPSLYFENQLNKTEKLKTEETRNCICITGIVLDDGQLQKNILKSSLPWNRVFPCALTYEEQCSKMDKYDT